MKQSMTEYISVLSSNEFDIFEEIVQKKYKKFKKFFYLMKENSDLIDKMEYKFTDSSNLSVILTCSKAPKKLKKELLDELESIGYIVNHEIKGKKINIEIEYDE